MKNTFTKFHLIGAVLTLFSLLVLGGCAPGTSSQPKAPGGPGGPGQAGAQTSDIVVKTAKVSMGTLETSHEATGTLSAKKQSKVAAQASGIVGHLYHQVGDWVQTGDAVIKLDDTLLKLTANNALSSLESAKINLQSGQQDTNSSNPKLALQYQSTQSALAAAQKTYDGKVALFKLGGVAEYEVSTAKSALQSAQAAVESAKSALESNQSSDTQALAQLKLVVDQADNNLKQAQFNLKNATVSAPYAGQIISLAVNEGEFVASNSTVFTLAGSDKVLSFQVPARDIGQFAHNRPISFEFAAKSYPVQISQMPTVPVDGSITVTAVLQAGANLAFGSVGTVRYTVNLSKGALVPSSAVQTEAGTDYVFLYKDGKATRTGVTFLSDNGIMAAVTNLTTTDEVITNPPTGLVDGATVKKIDTVATQENQGGQS